MPRKRTRTKKRGCSFWGGESASLPPVEAFPLAPGTTNAMDSAQMTVKAGDEQQNENNLLHLSGGAADIVIPQANEHGASQTGPNTGNSNATAGAGHLLASQADAQFDNCIGKPPGCGLDHTGGSIQTKNYTTVSCFSGGVKTRKNKRKIKRKRKTRGGRGTKAHKKIRTRRHRLKKKSKTHKKRK